MPNPEPSLRKVVEDGNVKNSVTPAQPKDSPRVPPPSLPGKEEKKGN